MRNKSYFTNITASVSVIVAVMLSSCGDTNGGLRNVNVLGPSDSIIYELDEDVSYHHSYCQYIQGDSVNIYSILNSYDNSILLYDASNGKFLKRISMALEGDDGVGRVQGYYYHNQDSIFTYQYGSGRCFLINSEGIVLANYSLFNPMEFGGSMEILCTSPYLESQSPMLLTADILHFPTSFLAETNKENSSNTFVTLDYNLLSGKVSQHNPYPAIYHKSNWGGGFFFRQVKSCIGSNGNIVLSYPADSNLWEYNPKDGSLISHPAACSSIGEIEPFDTKKDLFNDVDNERQEEWYYSQSNYEGVYHDIYKNVYYRIFRLPGSKQHEEGTFNDKKVGIAVYDEDFKYLSETILPDNLVYDTFNSYVSPQGLNIHIWKPEEEDKWIFYTYNLVE